MSLHELDLLRSAWSGTTVRSRVFRWAVYLTAVTFVLGFLNRTLDRYRDEAIDATLAEGIEIIASDDQIFLGFQCREEGWSNYVYDLNRQRLLNIAALAPQVLTQEATRPLSYLFPVTSEQLSTVMGVVGGGLGMPWLLDRARTGIFNVKLGAPARSAARNIVRFRTMDIVVATVSVIVLPVGGYIAGAYLARTMGTDVDCHGQKILRKLATPATWRAMVGTAFVHGYAYLERCIASNQRRLVPGLMVDYAEIRDNPELVKSLSNENVVATELLPLLGPNPPCANANDYSRCWTTDNIEKIVKAKEAEHIRTPLLLDTQLSNRVIQREFPTKIDGALPPANVSDALGKAFSRLSQGQLVNEAGETTVATDDIRLLISLRGACEMQLSQREKAKEEALQAEESKRIFLELIQQDR